MKKIKGITFVFIGCLLFSQVQALFVPKCNDSEWNSHLERFYDEAKNSIDVMFLGASLFVSSISPMELYHNDAIASYSLAQSAQPMFMSYYWLKEGCKYQKPKVVVLETWMLWAQPKDYGYRQNLEYMKLSPNKFEAVMQVHKIDKSQKISDYLFPMLYYHDRWETLNENDFDTGGGGITTEAFLLEHQSKNGNIMALSAKTAAKLRHCPKTVLGG